MATVLIVVGSSLMRAALKASILRMGHQVVGEALDGEEAIRIYHREKPDVVAVDIALPRLGGLQVLARLKEMDPGVRVIVCTGEARREVVVQAFREGVRDYVLRPFKQDRMSTALERATCGLKLAS
ncbi:MAG: response regulator [Candidatus Sericytochromatia bacterium]|nr:response regulator [Candidatus Tanganyikabacteria bacterium]